MDFLQVRREQGVKAGISREESWELPLIHHSVYRFTDLVN